MLRSILCTVAALAVSVSTLSAADAPKKDRPHTATVVKVDAASNTLVVKMRGKDGKEQERTLEIKEGVRLTGPEAGTEFKLADLKPGDMIEVIEKDGKLTQLLQTRRKQPPAGKEFSR